MKSRNFVTLLHDATGAEKHLCVDLNIDINALPPVVKKFSHLDDQVFTYVKGIVEATVSFVAAYRISTACYEKAGLTGRIAIGKIVRYIHELDSSIIIILDDKWGGAGDNNQGLVQRAFGDLDVDAVTVGHYTGMEEMKSLLDHTNKGVFVLCRSNGEGRDEFQGLKIRLSLSSLQELLHPDTHVGELCSQYGWGSFAPYYVSYYEYVALRVAHFWNRNGNCGLVVGTTDPRELLGVRTLVGPHLPIFIPDVKLYSSDIARLVLGVRGLGSSVFLLNVSSGIVSQGDDFAGVAHCAAEETHEKIVFAIQHPEVTNL